MRFLRKLRFLLFRSRFERELDEELRFHQAMKERDGATVESARRAIGNETLFKEQSRDAWIVAPLDNVLRDIRFACRTFRKNPGFVASATLTLALGLGVNTALFTVFNAFVLRPVPARDPDRLVQLGVAGKDFANFAFSWQDYVVLHEDHRVVEDLMAFADVQGSLAGSNGPDESWAQADLSGLAVSENYFRSLGAETILGRSFVPEADPSLGLRAVVVLSYQAWQRHFHGDPAVVGKTIRLTGHPLTVIGVASAEFTGLDITFPHFWIPAPMYATLTGRRTALEDTSWFRFQIVGRLKPDVSMAQARDALTSAIPSLNEHRIGDLRPDRMRLVSKKTIVPFDWRMVAPMMPIIIAFGLVLLISCANIANLLLARATARQQEVAVRVALGAGRGRLIHQLLTESTLLALGGGLLGFAFAHWIMTIVSKEVLPRVPTKGLLLVREIDVDSHAFLYVLALACVTGLLFGLAPRSQRLVLMCRRR